MRFTILLMALLIGFPAFGADFQKGRNAAARGDYATALKEWRPLAKQGVASAQNNLGVMYSKGHGVPQDHKKAVKWYRLSAEQGNANAHGNLGIVYFAGQGVPQDYAIAHMWWSIAVSKGNKSAKENRGKVAKKMTRVQITEAQRMAREWVAKHQK